MLRPVPRNVVNWGIVVALGVVVTALQIVAGPVVTLLLVAAQIAILVVLGIFLYRLWRDHRSRLSYLSPLQRLAFYGAAAVIVVVVLGAFLIDWSLITVVLFFAIVGACGYAMWRLWRETEGWY